MDDVQKVDQVLYHMNDYILSILDSVFDEYYDDIIALLPKGYEYLVTKRRIRKIVSGSRDVVRKMDPKIKRRIALEIRRVFEMAEDEYMHSVLQGEPDEGLGLMLQDMGQVHWNGI